MGNRADILDFYEDAPCGFLSVSPAGLIVRVNHTLTEWLGTSASKLLETPLSGLLSLGGRIAYETHVRPLLHMQGAVHELSIDLLDHAGERVPFIANVSERRGDDGEHISTRFALFKAKDRRLFEKSLIAAQQAAEEDAKRHRDTALLRDQFIAVLGHDLRNPLMSMMSGINILKRRGDLSERDLAILDGMNSSAWRAENLIKDVLDFARGRLGEGLVLQCAVQQDLAVPLSQVIDEARLMAPDRRIHNNMTIDCPVYCDSDRTGQLLSNLLANAITHGDPSREINVFAAADDETLTLSVENFGAAIPEEVCQNLFQPFFRGNVRERREGLGLGLFIVSEIAKAHGGNVDVISDENSIVFKLQMPVNAPAPTAP